MIRPLRARHRALFAALALVLPAGLAAALVIRPADPTLDQLPQALRVPGELRAGRVAWTLAGGWEEIPVSAELHIDDASGEAALVVTPFEDPRRPDLLVYWSPDGAGQRALAAERARLLGRVPGSAPTRLPIASDVLAEDGYLLLFSLAHGQVVASAPLDARVDGGAAQ